MEKDIGREFLDVFLSFPKIDTHEHLLPLEVFLGEADVLLSILRESYLPWICFGARDLKHYPWDRTTLLSEMKKVLASAFFKYLQQAFQFMYGFSGDLLQEETWQMLGGILRKAYEGNLPIEWLRGKLHIQKVVLDRYWVVDDYDLDGDFFTPVLRIDPYLFGFSASAGDHDRKNPYTPEIRKGKEILTFEDYLALIEQRVERGVHLGIVALKCAIAYDRGLDFPCPPLEKARIAFEREDNQESPEEIWNFQNFIFHYFLRQALEYNLPIQIHTGPGKYFRGAPYRLGPIFEEYPTLKISLLHGGFPWIGEPGAMALFYPNCHLDLTWLPLLSPTFSDLALAQWVEVTGGSRIMMGGDSWNVEGAVGAFLFNLESLSRVLGRMVENKYLNRNEAQEIGKRILWDNSREFFGERLRLSE